MENIESKLLHTKAMLYAMLAFLLVVLFSVSFVKTKEPDMGCGTKTNEAFCGTESSHSLSPEFQKGKELFVVNCASYHNKNMRDDLTDPTLAGVETRWAAFPRKDLYRFIRGSQAMIKEGHPRAVELWQKHKPTPMNDFPSLTDEDIEAILLYIER